MRADGRSLDDVGFNRAATVAFGSLRDARTPPPAQRLSDEGDSLDGEYCVGAVALVHETQLPAEFVSRAILSLCMMKARMADERRPDYRGVTDELLRRIAPLPPGEQDKVLIGWFSAFLGTVTPQTLRKLRAELLRREPSYGRDEALAQIDGQLAILSATGEAESALRD